jgi:hypothetical protein
MASYSIIPEADLPILLLLIEVELNVYLNNKLLLIIGWLLILIFVILGVIIVSKLLLVFII